VEVWKAVILGIIQGLTEFLPVSSSGHLVLFGTLLQVEQPGMLLEIMLHLGTLIAVFLAFWPEVTLLARSGFTILRNPARAPQLVREDANCRLLLVIVLATIPIALVGLVADDWIVRFFDNPAFTGAMLCVTGGILFIAARTRKGVKPIEEISFPDGLLIGLGQALAVLPGISRSGTTIAAGMLRGVNRESAARFSFLLSIPAVLGSQVLAVKELLGSPNIGESLPALALGTIFAAAAGYLAIRLLLSTIRRGRLVYFVYYTWFVGLMVLLLA
jgi:undecaprenyl-diphosphatase